MTSPARAEALRRIRGLRKRDAAGIPCYPDCSAQIAGVLCDCPAREHRELAAMVGAGMYLTAIGVVVGLVMAVVWVVVS